MDPITETFEQAEAALADLLRKSQLPADLVWINRDEITGFKHTIIHPHPAQENRELYRRHYDIGVQRRLGICLKVESFTSDTAYCYLWWPKDEGHADAAMMSGGLRLSHPTKPSPARISKSRLGFFLQKTWYSLRGESPFIESIPTRAALQFQMHL